MMILIFDEARSLHRKDRVSKNVFSQAVIFQRRKDNLDFCPLPLGGMISSVTW